MLAGQVKKKKSVDSLLPLYGGLMTLKNKAGLKKKVGESYLKQSKEKVA